MPRFDQAVKWAGVRTRRSYPTVYRHTRFRSKLEADWARCFDVLRIRWEYEPEGIYCGDVFVLPDFWLPKAQQWFEVKATLTDDDVRRFSALTAWLAHETSEDELLPFVVFGWPDGMLSLARAGGPGMIDFCASTAALVSCDDCSSRYFVDSSESWTCPNCGRSGDGLDWLRDQTYADDYRWSGWPAAFSTY